MITDVLIMAGGFGERLWPASSSSFPKQFMALNDGLSFLQESLKRALALDVQGKIVIVTRSEIHLECASQCLNLASIESKKNASKILKDVVILCEPCAKHTAAAIMSGVCCLNKLNGRNSSILVMTSDHVISPVEKFVSDCKNAARACEDKKFVCFSIPPLEAATGYGYIKTGNDVYADGCVFKIENFEEKPDFETAKKYLEHGGYWWNSGMFAFTSDFFISEMKICTPEIYNAFLPMINGKVPKLKSVKGIKTILKWKEMNETYASVVSIAVDKAVAEKTENAVAVRSTFNWTDVGSWDVFSTLCTNPKNAPSGQAESKNNFIYSDLPVALCGVENLIVVVKNSKVLVMKKGCSPLVKEASAALKDL